MKIKISGTVISHVLCDCAALFLTLREEHCLRVFENRVFGAVCERIIKVMESVNQLEFLLRYYDFENKNFPLVI